MCMLSHYPDPPHACHCFAVTLPTAVCHVLSDPYLSLPFLLLLRHQSQFAMYYQLPTLSLKAACHHLLVDGTRPGFWVNVTRNQKMEIYANVSGAMLSDGWRGRPCVQLGLHSQGRAQKRKV